MWCTKGNVKHVGDNGYCLDGNVVERAWFKIIQARNCTIYAMFGNIFRMIDGEKRNE
jgi:hypothetical protein